LRTNIVYRGQSAVVVDEGAQECVRRDDFVEHLDLFVFLEERLAALGVAEVLDECVDVLVVEDEGSGGIPAPSLISEGDRNVPPPLTSS